MKQFNSAFYTAVLAKGLSSEELPLSERSDRWWDLFWHYVGIDEAQRIKENTK